MHKQLKKSPKPQVITLHGSFPKPLVYVGIDFRVVSSFAGVSSIAMATVWKAEKALLPSPCQPLSASQGPFLPLLQPRGTVVEGTKY